MKIPFDEFCLDQVPLAEDDHFEFKGSQITLDKLATELQQAASAFANAGGGYLLAGIDKQTASADGGIPKKNGKTNTLDWTDQVLHRVEPPVQYTRKFIDDVSGRGFLNPNAAILAVHFPESYFCPHQAPDGKYYIRAGAHTVPARHFIVEALWAKRHQSKPRLAHLLRVKPGIDDVVQLGILALTDAPALNVSAELDPLPSRLAQYREFFPLNVQIIDRQNPFYLDVGLWLKGDFGPPVNLALTYHDLAGNRYSTKSLVDDTKSLPPKRIGGDSVLKISRSLESIDEAIKKYLSR